MKQILRLALNDLRLTARDRPAFLWTLVLPVVMMWLIGGLGGGSGSQRVTLAVVDHDGGWLAASFLEQLSDEDLNLRRLSPDEAATAEDLVRTLVIPPDFTRGVLAGEQRTVRLEKSEGASQSFSMAAQVHIVRAIVRSLSSLARLEPAAGEDDATLARRFGELSAEALPVRLDVSQAGVGRPVPSGTAQSVPGILTMTVMMMTLIYGAVFLTLEKSSGMLRRQAGLPISRHRLLLGKVLGRLLLAGLQIVALVLAGRFFFGVSWGSSPIGLALVLTSYAVAVAGLATLLGAVLRNAAQASAVGWIGTMVMAALGGCWWPSEVMPGWIRTAAHVFPTAWAMDAFHALISFGHGLDAVLLPSVVLLGFGAAFTLAGARLMRFEA